jgi:hypothetical protein
MSMAIKIKSHPEIREHRGSMDKPPCYGMSALLSTTAGHGSIVSLNEQKGDIHSIGQGFTAIMEDGSVCRPQEKTLIRRDT